MKKEDIIKLLLNLESAIVSGNLEQLWFDADSIPECWKLLNCEKKRCPAYNRRNVRCWHIAGTFCTEQEASGDFVQKWGDCRECHVYKTTIKDEDQMIKELLNNIIFSIKCYDPQAVTTIQIRKNIQNITNQFELTVREREVLFLVLGRLSRKEIATSLSISYETVKMHLKNIYKKVNVKSREDLHQKLSDLSNPETTSNPE